MEHGSSPTNSPGRTPIQIAGRFAVLLDFPGFLILESTTRMLWNMVRVRPTTLVGQPIQIVGRLLFSVIILASITLWWLVRVRPAPPRIRGQLATPFLWECPKSGTVRARV